MSNQTILLVGNPTSHSGKAAKRIENALSLLRDKQIPVEFRSTLPHGQTVDMVTRAIDEEGVSTLVYMGGDGTFYEVATGICNSRNPESVRLGMLPSGTANDQGKSFGISSAPGALKKNIDIILEGNTEAIDVGRITAFNEGGEPILSDYFFDSLGWGLSAAILAFRNRELKRVNKVPVWRNIYRDQAVYWRAGVREFSLKWLTGDRFSAEIEVDGTAHHLPHLSDIIISNTPVYAGEWVIDPNSSASDGQLEIAPFCGLRDWSSKLIIQHKKTAITEQMLNKIGLTHSKTLKGADIKIHILRPAVDKRLPAQRDGEEFCAVDDYQVTILPAMLNLIVPKNFHWI